MELLANYIPIYSPECALSKATKIIRACEFLSTIFKDITTTLVIKSYASKKPQETSNLDAITCKLYTNLFSRMCSILGYQNY